jgi:phosphoglycolate phosphatase-like HAD superfamily hydrolase
LARATKLLPAEGVSSSKLNELFDAMYDYIGTLDDTEIADGISPLPGVMDTLSVLATMKEQVVCGLVTGNVEGIARRKMKAVGIWDTGALAPASAEQLETGKWKGSEDFSFVGGFGSDYCSRDIDDESRNYLDRGEQIAIAVNRCRSSYPDKDLKRVVHVGDAPADILAAKSLSQRYVDESKVGMCVGCVGVATGSYSADELRELAGVAIPGVWEPVILEDGLGCDSAQFLEACGL